MEENKQLRKSPPDPVPAVVRVHIVLELQAKSPPDPVPAAVGDAKSAHLLTVRISTEGQITTGADVPANIE